MTGRGLRATVVFHEAHALGAGIAVARIAEPLRDHGWTLRAWLPEDGDLQPELTGFAGIESSEVGKPIAYSARGWQAAPGLGVRLARTPGYLTEFRRALYRQRPHV